MSFADPIGDMITRIRNAQLRMLKNVVIPCSNFRERILIVLKQEGYIADYKLLSGTLDFSVKCQKVFSNWIDLASAKESPKTAILK